MDLHELWITRLPLNIPLRILYFVLSYLIICFGIALSNRCKLPIIPTDLFPREAADITKVPYARIKIGFDVTCLVITACMTFFCLGHIMGLGIGTIVAAFTMGKGIAIEPTVGQVVAPFDGTVTALFHTKHAIGLTSDEGVEVLIHVGIDTVQLNGEHYKAYIQNGDKIKAGDLLVEFDIEAIKVDGYEVVTPVIITNTPTYSDIIPMKEGLILKGEELLTIL